MTAEFHLQLTKVFLMSDQNIESVSLLLSRVVVVFLLPLKILGSLELGFIYSSTLINGISYHPKFLFNIFNSKHKIWRHS